MQKTEKSDESGKIEKLFGKFIATRKIMIADESASSRTGLAKTIIDLGAHPQNVSLVSSYAVAIEEMDRIKPQMVICDYNLGNGNGLNLLQAQRKNRPESKDSLFVLVTGNTSQSAVAQAAEEDVDTFVIKPYTLETLRQSIVRATIAKIYPSDYVKTIDEGKKQLFEGQIDVAMETFTKAMALHPKPTLACFYKGQAYLIKTSLDSAEKSYSDGLTFNKIHYKCMVGLYELLMTKKMHTEAYDVVKKISRYFPANPQRLASVLRLAIMTKSYDDIENYYRVFTGLDQRNEEITKYICAALVVCGKYYLQKNFNSRGLELFSKAATTASGRTKVLREIIIALLTYDLVNDAKDFLGRFQPATHGSADYKAMDALVTDRFVSPSHSISNCRELISSGVHDPLVYKVLIQRSLEAGLRDAAETLLQTAEQKWPQMESELKAVFEKFPLAKTNAPPKEAKQDAS